jgi:hypothetical protein
MASFFPSDPPKDEPFYIGEHYLYDGFWYYHKFPVEWAKDHHGDSGPKLCANCAEYGTLHHGSVFVGYCIHCAQGVYEKMRGPGFVDYGRVEGGGTLESTCYLHGVDLDSISPLLWDVSPPPSDLDDGEEQQQQQQHSILEPHFEGGYNDY